MRITGGSYRGRNIKCPPGIIRPAMDRMRESLFSILGNISGCSFLDLFSGSGLVGIEAASRGADPVILVEKDFKKKYTIRENISFVEESITLILSPVEKFIKSGKSKFDLIYLDPPFNYKKKTRLIELIGDADILKPDGEIIMHYPDEDDIPETIGPFQMTDRRAYGRSILKFYRFREESPDNPIE